MTIEWFEYYKSAHGKILNPDIEGDRDLQPYITCDRSYTPGACVGWYENDGWINEEFPTLEEAKDFALVKVIEWRMS